ncbi:MAG: extracellular solute-binding protein [Actinomycetota bacterium]
MSAPSEEAGLEYRVLGRLDVDRDGGSVDLGAHRQRAVLALLLMHANTVVSTDSLLDELWGPDEGASRQNALWVYVSGLRGALEPDRQKRTDGTILLTRSPGYVLEVDPSSIDAIRFERLLNEGRLLAETDPGAASLVLGEALGLWHGAAYEDFAYESFAQREIARLEDLRLEAVEARVDADLARGLGRELVSELETLVAQQPLREWTTGQLMTALYRSGRQAEALRAYADLRNRLGTELGVEPSPRLRRLEEQIVVGDPELDVQGTGAVTGTGAQPGLAVRGYELRESVARGPDGEVFRAFQPAVGREVDIRVIGPDIADDPSFVRRFDHDARSAALLEHPHVVPVYDHWREPGAAYVVTRAVTGGTLADVLAQRGLRPDEAARLVDQVGSALHAFHRSGLVHGNVAAETIAVDDDLNAYLGEPSLTAEDRGTTADDVLALARVASEGLTGLRGDIEQVRGALPVGVRAVVEDLVTSDAEPEVAAFVTGVRRALSDPDAEAGWSEELENPYKGLRAFGFGDAETFFGRERLVARLVNRIALPGPKGRFIAVVGPSGSGKSSVVRAGLLPAVRAGAAPGSEQWFTTAMTPAPHPFESLEGALTAIAIEPPVSLLDAIIEDGGLHRTLHRILPDDGSQLVLLVDQFEELFTQVDESTAERFLDALVDAIAHEGSRLHVVATLRADFYDRPLRHRGIGELVREGTEVITPMTPEELERAITGPTDAVGVRYEPGLVAALINDVVDRPGALPLLQYALTELFDAREGAAITAQAYHDLGRVSGALVARAESLLFGLGADADNVARQLFLRLVTLGEGSDDTRRRILRSEVESLPVDHVVLASILDTFGRHRLLSFDRDPVTRGPTVEISHESLLTGWHRLEHWIESARDDVRNQRRLAEAMEEWNAADQRDDYLLRGGRLAQLDAWAATSKFTLSTAEQDFLTSSLDVRAREQEAELETEKRALKAEERARSRTRLLTLAGLATIVVAALAVFGITQWLSAEDARESAELDRAAAQEASAAAAEAQAAAEVALVAVEQAQAEKDALLTAARLVTESESQLPLDPTLALQLAIEAVYATADFGFATEDAVDQVHWALQDLGVQFDVGPLLRGNIAVRSGPRGLTGVYALPPAELVAFASRHALVLSDEQCQQYLQGPCHDRDQLPADLRLYLGMEAYMQSSSPNNRPTFTTASPLAGSRIRMAAPLFDGDLGFLAELQSFTDTTGIQVSLVNAGGDELQSLFRGDPNSVDIVLAPNRVPEWARGRALDLTAFLDEDTLVRDFGQSALRRARLDPVGADDADSTIRGIPAFAFLKGMVFYPKERFEEAGYEVPESWEELIALADRMVADGRTPFCFGFESGDATGWLGTDLIEALALQTAGVETYDRWVEGEVAFSHPAIIEAGRRAEELLSGPGYVINGRESITRTDFGEPYFMLMARDPESGDVDPACWMAPHTDWLLDFREADIQLGRDLDFFMLPPVDPDTPAPVLGNVIFATAMADRPEVRALMGTIASPTWGSTWSEQPEADFISANRRSDSTNIACLRFGPCDEFYVTVRRRISDVVRQAIRDDRYRPDGSDAMPAAIGGFDTDLNRPGAFWQGIVEWADGVKTIEEVFADIDAAREELASQSG